MILTEFNKALFLRDFWQKKPCVIRQFLPEFIDPIDENDLAGLAMEDGVDCRIISENKGKWEVTTGPFTEFDNACINNWTLMVQAVDRYIEDIDALTEHFSFIPNWRFDDVMASYSQIDAGVGPHIDEYDVFIIQGKGSRRWQVGLPGQYSTVKPNPLLSQVEAFNCVIDETLVSGDVIYIPPKFPHNGRSLEPCLNYSIGFRAPTASETLVGLLDEDIFDTNALRYSDPHLSTRQHAALVTQTELKKLKDNIKRLLHQSDIDGALLSLLSRQYLPENIDTLDDSVCLEDIKSNNITLIKKLGLRPLYTQSAATSQMGDNHFEFYIEGELYHAPIQTKSSLLSMFNSSSFHIHYNDTKDWPDDTISLWILLLNTLLKKGYWYL